MMIMLNSNSRGRSSGKLGLGLGWTLDRAGLPSLPRPARSVLT